MTSRLLDLAECPGDIPVEVYAYHALKGLVPGDETVLLTAQDPEILLCQLQRQLQGALIWQVDKLDASRWRVTIKRRESREQTTLAVILKRDHECLERLFVQARQLVGEGRVQLARPFVRLFVEGLRRHIQVESDILTPAFPARPGAANGDARTMQREHDDILQRTEAIEAAFRASAPDSLALDAQFRGLAAVLARHEHWEETVVYPKWDTYLSENDDGQALFDRLKSTLATAPHNLAPQKFNPA